LLPSFYTGPFGVGLLYFLRKAWDRGQSWGVALSSSIAGSFSHWNIFYVLHKS
jgi:hypothetical protein